MDEQQGRPPGGYRPQDGQYPGLGGPPPQYGPPPGDGGWGAQHPGAPAQGGSWEPAPGQGGQYSPASGEYGPPPGPGGQYGPPPGQYGPPPGGPPPGEAPTQAWGAGPQGPPPPGYGGQPAYGQPGYGQPAYGQPGYGQGPTGLGPIAPAPRRSRARVLWTTVAAGTAVVLTAGGVYAYSALSGTSAVLPAKVPADAVAYLEVNLDPPAGQKVAAIRFLRKFPEAKTGGEDGSLLDSVVEPLIEDPETRRLYVESIKPWLGKHAAVIADPQDGKVLPVVVAETTDAGRTRTGLDRINAQEKDDKDKVRYAISDGIVYMAETQAAADTAAKDAGAGGLDSNATFTADVDKVGDDGIVTFWSDLAEAAKIDPDASTTAAAKGRVAGSLRFTDSTADLVVRSFGGSIKAGPEVLGGRVAKLPADTAAAVAVSGADDLIRSAYEQLDKVGLGRQLSKVEEDTGLDLPDDAAALVGSSTVIALGAGDDPAFGIVSKTDDPAGAKRAAEALLSKLGEDGGPLTVESVADGTVLASSAEYAKALQGDGGLGKDADFRAALPELDSATAVVYVDVHRLAEFGDEEVLKEYAALRAFGLTASVNGGDSTVHVRLVAR